MSLLPYLYSAFVEYWKTGKPPIRALVLDYPEDIKTRMIDDEYLFGDSLLVCPLTYEEGIHRKVYLPNGNWYNFFNGKMIKGGQIIEVYADYNEIPVFVKEGAIIPIAAPVSYVNKNTIFQMEVKIWGEADGVYVLYDDDFETFDFEKDQNRVLIEKHPGTELVIKQDRGKASRYYFE